MRYRPYESYYQPEVDWLDEMPSHWEVRRTKTMLSLQKSKVGRAASEHTLLSLTLGGVVPRVISEGGKFPAEFDTYQVVKPDDLVFCLFDIDETPRTIGIARDDGMITGAYSVYRAHGPCVPEYACYYFLHLDSFKGLRPFYTGLRKVVRADTFSKVEMPAPPFEEQTQIAKFLDYETAKIDALIEKQQQLISLLKEKRQAVISHAVTKGLNPDSPMRDSGVEWLGEIPAHWPTAKLARFIRVGSGEFLPNEDYSEAGESEAGWAVPVVGGNGVSGWTSKPNSPPRTMVIGRVGALCGNVHLVEEASWVTDNALKIVSSPVFVPEYLVDLLRFRNLNDLADRSAQPLITGSRIKGQVVPVPPTLEQKEIVSFLRKKLLAFDETSAAARAIVDLLQERRTALISAAVTGKIDVRDWEAPAAQAEAEVA